jgi:hypothetical protein
MKRIYSALPLLLACCMLLSSCGEKDSTTTDDAIDSATTELTPSDEPDTDVNAQEASDEMDMDDSENAEAPDEVAPDGSDAEIPELESVGGIRLNQKGTKVVAVLGEAPEKGEWETWDFDGVDRQTWLYSDAGVELTMARTDDSGITVDRIDVMKNSKLRTARGIGIGSTRRDVMNAYKDDLAPEEEQTDPASVVIGSIYGGIIFDFENDKVTRIFVGAAAE